VSPLRIADQRQPHVAAGSDSDSGVVAVIDQLQQRELLAPFLLLSTGYCALPFILQQLLLLLTPLAAILGFAPERHRERA